MNINKYTEKAQEAVVSAQQLADPAPDGVSILPHVASKKLGEKDWHKLRRSEDEQGNTVVEQRAPSQFNGLSPSHFGQSGLNDSVEVPEPSTALIALSALALATLHRRPRRRRPQV